jgi:hypothetical protein
MQPHPENSPGRADTCPIDRARLVAIDEETTARDSDAGARARLDLLGSPVFATSVAVLLLNDHVLKSMWPGVVTGKLSDVAGVVMIAIVLTALTGRVDPAVVATAVGFGLPKTVPIVAVWAAPVLGGVTRTDPLDLVALLALVPLRRWMAPRRGRSANGTARHRWVPRVALLAAAAFATSATSCDEKGVFGVVEFRGTLLASTSDVDFISEDGGATWRKATDDDEFDYYSVARRSEGCASGVCVGADPRTNRLTERYAGRTTTILELTDDQYTAIAELGTAECGPNVFSTVAVAGASDGAHIIVGMGPAGALHRAPDGRWEWVRIGRWSVPGSSGDTYLGIPVADD